MKIQLKEIPVRDVAQNFVNNEEEGVIGYDGKLNIRPKYQREFIYKDTQRDAVIDTVRKNFPLNVMYWAVNEDGTYEVLDGQQRTISICQYVAGDFSVEYQYFHNLTHDEQEQILDYKLMVYFCEGDDREKLEWFKTINIAGEKLTDQELRNAIYTGTWLTDAKRYFSRSNGAAYNLAKDYVNGSPIRQDYLETAIKWISNNAIERYMSQNQHAQNANELWMYFQGVINWVSLTFPHYRREMKGVDWGKLHNAYKDEKYDTDALESEIAELMMDEDVTKKSGIYEYVLTREEKYLSIRAFTDNMKREAYERQAGVCVTCGKRFDITEMEADHITPWIEGGHTNAANCQMLCRDDNRRKGKG